MKDAKTETRRPSHSHEAEDWAFNHDFSDILSPSEHEHRPEGSGTGTVEGTVLSVSPETVVVDIGRKMEGIVSYQKLRDSGVSTVKQGDRIAVVVTGSSNEGYYELSTVRVERRKAWTGLIEAFQSQKTIAGAVVELIKGGLRVDIGVPAFMPASRTGARDVPEMGRLVGQEIQCRIVRLDPEKEDVVVDRRIIVDETAVKARKEAYSHLKAGEIREGTVRVVTEFGVFVDIGGVDGLVHISDMSWNRAKPSDLVSAGDRVKVKILQIDAGRDRITLGMKQLLPEHPTGLGLEQAPGAPRDEAQRKSPIGTDPFPVEAPIANLAKFGAAGKHFRVLTSGRSSLAHPLIQASNELRLALAAGDLRNPDELRRITPGVEALATPDTILLVAGYHADDFVASPEVTSLRRKMEQMGAVFVPRPAEAKTLQKVAEFLDRQYAPDPEAIEAARRPAPAVPLLAGHDIAPYLEPPPSEFEGDPFFLAELENDSGR